MNRNRTYICGIRRMAFNDKTVHTHVYYYLFTITRKILLLRSSTVRLYRKWKTKMKMKKTYMKGELFWWRKQHEQAEKARTALHTLFSAIVNSIPSYEISIIIFVYIYIYMTNDTYRNIATIIIIMKYYCNYYYYYRCDYYYYHYYYEYGRHLLLLLQLLLPVKTMKVRRIIAKN